MSRPQIIAFDWDHTLWDTENDRMFPRAVDAVWRVKSEGFEILIHSCNRPEWLRRMCEEHDVPFDYIWGEDPSHQGKPVCAVYVDDRGFRFDGQWNEDKVFAILYQAERNPVRDNRGPVYTGNPRRMA